MLRCCWLPLVCCFLLTYTLLSVFLDAVAFIPQNGRGSRRSSNSSRIEPVNHMLHVELCCYSHYVSSNISISSKDAIGNWHMVCLPKCGNVICQPAIPVWACRHVVCLHGSSSQAICLWCKWRLQTGTAFGNAVCGETFCIIISCFDFASPLHVRQFQALAVCTV